jgi:hypothetical protein
MKNKYLLLLVSVFALLFLGSSLLCATGGDVEKRNFIIVSHDHRETIHVAVGDIVQFNAKNLPLIPDNLNKSFSVSYDREFIRLIANIPLDVEGPMGREVYVKPLKAGKTKLKILLLEGKTTVEEYIFTLQIN